MAKCYNWTVPTRTFRLMTQAEYREELLAVLMWGIRQQMNRFRDRGGMGR